MRKALAVAIGLVVFTLALTADLGLQWQAQSVLAVTLLAGVLWFSEVMPLHVTGLLAAFLLMTVSGFQPIEVTTPFFDPVIMLLLGGFILARGMQKHGLDEFVALTILKKTGDKPKRVLLGLMGVTAFLSMWMSNTASTAIMLPIGMIVLAKNGLAPLKSNYGKAMALGIAYAATIGGIGTIVGTTPNAIAVKFLADNGVKVTFAQWMYYGLPLVIIMVPVAWLLMTLLFKPEIERVKLAKRADGMTPEQKKVSGIFLVTVCLWLTTFWHGFASSTVALVPIILLYALNLLEGNDFSKINWGALILVGAGLSLGTAIHASGLDMFLASLIESFIAGQGLFMVLLVIALFAIILTLFAANTAAGAVLVPIVIPLALSLGLDIRLLAVLVAMAVSLDFIVPVGTPPNAIAYSSGFIRMKDMVKAGIPLSLTGALVLAALSYLFW